MKNELTRYNDRYNDYDFFEEAMRDFFPSVYGGKHGKNRSYMRTDIKEKDDGYLMEVEIPGVDKKDISIDLEDGYLTVAVNKTEKNDGGKRDNYIHRERSYSCSRSYYVGDVKQEDIKARYENGVLNISLPKAADKKDSQSRIMIE